MISFPPRARSGALPSPQSLMLLQIEMFAELFAGAGDAQARGYLASVGARLAGLSLVPPDAESADALADAINRLWSELDWGRATLSLDGEGIDIVHVGMPLSIDGDDDGMWKKGALCILQGAYDAWFRAMGSGPDLTTRVVSSVAGRIELRHGF